MMRPRTIAVAIGRIEPRVGRPHIAVAFGGIHNLRLRLLRADFRTLALTTHRVPHSGLDPRKNDF